MLNVNIYFFSGDIIIADTDNHRIQVFDCNGVFKLKMGEKGSLPHHLNHPMCVAMTMDGNIAVTDSVNASIKIFSQEGSFLIEHTCGGVFDFPYGIAISSENFFVVTDLCKHSIMVIYPSGSVCRQFGKYGDGLLEFDHPYHVALTPENHIVIADSGNSAIKIFNIEGKLLRKFGMYDFRLFNEQFLLLQGLCIDSDSNIILIGNNTIYIVAMNGRLWEVIIPSDGLDSPKCIAYSQSGHLVVTQSGLDLCNEVCVYKYTKEDFKSLRALPGLSCQTCNGNHTTNGYGTTSTATG